MALFSLFIIFGALFLAASESSAETSLIEFTNTPLPDPTATGLVLPPEFLTQAANATSIPPSNTPFPTPIDCTPPAGWAAYTVGNEDTFASFAIKHGVSETELQNGNCLASPVFQGGDVIYAPNPTATPTNPPASTPTAGPTTVGCVPRSGWINYTVKSGDNLFRIGLAYGVSAGDLSAGNCLTNTTIYTGQIIKVPNVPTRTPTTTISPTYTATTVPSATPTITLSPTITISPTVTLTSTITPTPDLTETAIALTPP